MTLDLAPEPDTLIGQGRTAEIYAWGPDQVLKLYHRGWPASWVEQEAYISRQVAQTGLPVPAVGGVIEVHGRTGILFERVAGPTLVQRFMTQPWTLPSALRAFTDLHLAMHAQTLPDLPAQRDQLVRLIHEATVAPEAIRQAALHRLEHLPDGSSLCHGDFHPENVLMTQNGPIIIDWAVATRGHPLADVARTELLLRMGALPESSTSRRRRWLIGSARLVVHAAYLHRYLHRRPAPITDLALWQLPIAVARLGEGIAEEQEPLLRLIESLRP
jgi:uncharacterized protein (TIGR02172 family)